MVDVIQASSRALKIISEQKKTISSNAEKAIDQLRVKIKSLREVIDSLNNKIENEHIISSNLRMELKAALNESESRAANIAGLEDKISNLELTNNELKKELNQTKIELESSKAELSNVSDFFKTLNSEIHNKLMSALEEANEIITNEDPEFQLKDVEDSEND
jgi:chromosome segregation ATPase